MPRSRVRSPSSPPSPRSRSEFPAPIDVRSPPQETLHGPPLRHSRPRRVRGAEDPQGNLHPRIQGPAQHVGRRDEAPGQQPRGPGSHRAVRAGRRHSARSARARQRRALDQSFLRSELRHLRGRRGARVHRSAAHHQAGRGAELRLSARDRRAADEARARALHLSLRRPELPRLAAQVSTPFW